MSKLHLAAYTAAVGSTANTAVQALTDDYLDVLGTGFRLRSPAKLFAAWAGSPTLNRLRFDSPSLRLIGNPFLRPLQAAILPAQDPNLMDLTRNPFALKMGEQIDAQITAAPAMTERATILIWLAERITPVPIGDVYAIRFTSTGAAVANAWTTITLTLDQSIAPGEYALVGSEHQSTNAIAHRWIIPDRPWRPGFLSVTAVENRTHKLLYEGGLGDWGRFWNTSLPQLQVLCNAADATHVGWMYIVRMRDMAPMQ